MTQTFSQISSGWNKNISYNCDPMSFSIINNNKCNNGFYIDKKILYELNTKICELEKNAITKIVSTNNTVGFPTVGSQGTGSCVDLSVLSSGGLPVYGDGTPLVIGGNSLTLLYTGTESQISATVGKLTISNSGSDINMKLDNNENNDTGTFKVINENDETILKVDNTEVKIVGDMNVEGIITASNSLSITNLSLPGTLEVAGLSTFESNIKMLTGNYINTVSNETLLKITDLGIEVNGKITSNDSLTPKLKVTTELDVTGANIIGMSSNSETDASLFEISKGNMGNDNNIGVYGRYIKDNMTKYSGYYWDHTNEKFSFFYNLDAKPDTTVPTSNLGTILGNFETVNNVIFSNNKISLNNDSSIEFNTENIAISKLEISNELKLAGANVTGLTEVEAPFTIGNITIKADSINYTNNAQPSIEFKDNSQVDIPGLLNLGNNIRLNNNATIGTDVTNDLIEINSTGDGIIINGTLTTIGDDGGNVGDVIVPDGGTVGSVSKTDAITIAGDGNVSFINGVTVDGPTVVNGPTTNITGGTSIVGSLMITGSTAINGSLAINGNSITPTKGITIDNQTEGSETIINLPDDTSIFKILRGAESIFEIKGDGSFDIDGGSLANKTFRLRGDLQVDLGHNIGSGLNITSDSDISQLITSDTNFNITNTKNDGVIKNILGSNTNSSMFAINNGTTDIFTVQGDGSISIGSNATNSVTTNIYGSTLFRNITTNSDDAYFEKAINLGNSTFIIDTANNSSRMTCNDTFELNTKGTCSVNIRPSSGVRKFSINNTQKEILGIDTDGNFKITGGSQNFPFNDIVLNLEANGTGYIGQDGYTFTFKGNVEVDGTSTYKNGLEISASEGGSAELIFKADEGDDATDIWNIGVLDGGPFNIYKYNGSTYDSVLDLATAGTLGVPGGISLGSNNELSLNKTGNDSLITNNRGNLILNNTAPTGKTEIKLATDDPDTGFNIRNNTDKVLLSVPSTGVSMFNGPLFSMFAPVIIDASSNITYTVDNFLSGLIIRDPNGDARSDITPTAQEIISTIPNCQNNIAFQLIIKNKKLDAGSSHTITLTENTGITIIDNSVINEQSVKVYMCHIKNISSNAEEIDIYPLMTSQW